MAVSTATQQQIFLAYRALFEGQNARVRQAKAIRKVLESGHATSSPLVFRLGYDKVVSVLKDLLEADIFSSDLLAKLKFPVLFETSPEQEARHEASDVGAAKVEADALHEIENSDNAATNRLNAEWLEDGIDVYNDVQQPFLTNGITDDDKNEVQATKNTVNDTIPSLYPVHLPFKVQHSVLNSIQKLLEECCYHFSQKHAPNLLVDKDWDCAEAIELNKWAYIFLKRHVKSSAGALERSDASIHQLSFGVIKIRHAAVHRVRISAKGLLQMVETAAKFAETLSDQLRASQLEELYRELKSKVRAQELNKNYLETRLKDELEEIEQERKALAKREEDAINSAINEDKDQMCFVGSLLENDLRKILGGDRAEDSADSDHSDDQPDDAENPGAPESPKYAMLPKESGTPQQVPKQEGTSSDVDHNERSTSIHRGGPNEKGHTIDLELEYTSNEKLHPYAPTLDSPDEHEDFGKPMNGAIETSSMREEPTTEFEPRAPSPDADFIDVKNSPTTSAYQEPIVEPVIQESAPEKQPEAHFASSMPEVPLESIPEAVQLILNYQNIDTAHLKQMQRKVKKKKTKQHKRVYDEKMSEIKRDVTQSLRHQLNNGSFGDLILTQIEEYLKKQEGS